MATKPTVMNKAEILKQNYIRYHKTSDGKLKGISLEFANEIEINSFLEQYAQQVSREVAIQFKMNTSPLTPQIVDGEKKVRQQTEKLFDNWIKNQ